MCPHGLIVLYGPQPMKSALTSFISTRVVAAVPLITVKHPEILRFAVTST